MRIVNRQGDQGGVEREFAVVHNDGETLVYFSPAGASKVQLNGPHFVVAPSVPYGVAAGNIDLLRNLFTEFVCPDFADSEELKQLRAENAELRRSQPAAQELEGFRADREELELYRAEERERAQLKDRQAVLDTPHNKRAPGRPREKAA